MNAVFNMKSFTLGCITDCVAAVVFQENRVSTKNLVRVIALFPYTVYR
jgi:hypothetical protein